VTRYDTIGQGYRNYRLPDVRIAKLLDEALNGASTVLNIGAGAGSYEPVDRPVVALEPSWVMLAQRAAGQAPAVQGVVESLPFADDTFAACLGVLTLHHWRDKAQGLREAVRVARERVVLLSWVGYINRFWLFDYFPEIEAIDEAIFPTPQWIEEVTGCAVSQRIVNLPADCSDGFLCGYWARPEAYLEAGVRAAISTFALLQNVETRLEQLRADLASGAWHERHGELLQRDTMDYGYRVLTLDIRQ
jgi:SAM-dependent methyltransferase